MYSMRLYDEKRKKACRGLRGPFLHWNWGDGYGNGRKRMGEGRRTEIPVSEAFRCHGAKVYMKITKITKKQRLCIFWLPAEKTRDVGGPHSPPTSRPYCHSLPHAAPIFQHFLKISLNIRLQIHIACDIMAGSIKTNIHSPKPVYSVCRRAEVMLCFGMRIL